LRAVILCRGGLLILLGTVLMSSAAAAADKPHILFLLSDDHSYPFVGCYGDRNVRTPTLDRLAAEGMKFHRFFTGAPQCVPSRATLMTGRSPVAARMTRFSAPLPRDEVTFPELLRDQAGYATGVYTGTVTVTASPPDTQDSPQQLEVVLRVVPKLVRVYLPAVLRNFTPPQTVILP